MRRAAHAQRIEQVLEPRHHAVRHAQYVEDMPDGPGSEIRNISAKSQINKLMLLAILLNAF
jgi:hypothetical protein